MKIRSLLAAGAAFAALSVAAPASADIIIIDENCSSCDNVHLFEDDNAADFFMHGETFQNSGIDVLFTGIETLKDTGPGGGVAWVGAADGSTTFLDISIEDGFTFTDLGFNLNETNVSGNPSWMVEITGVEDNGQETSDVFTLSQNTMFTVHSFNGQRMRNVRIQLLDPSQPDGLAQENGVLVVTPNPNDDDEFLALDGAGQVKIGGVEPTIIPEPATWGLMITGFAGMGVMLRRRRAQLAFASV